MRWQVKQRIGFIQATLIRKGTINREDITREFSVSTQQASADIAAFMRMHPDVMVYDKSLKTFKATVNGNLEVQDDGWNRDAFLEWVKQNRQAVYALLEGKAAVVPIWEGEHGTYLGKPDDWRLRIGNCDLADIRLDQPSKGTETEEGQCANRSTEPAGTAEVQ